MKNNLSSIAGKLPVFPGLHSLIPDFLSKVWDETWDKNSMKNSLLSSSKSFNGNPVKLRNCESLFFIFLYSNASFFLQLYEKIYNILINFLYDAILSIIGDNRKRNHSLREISDTVFYLLKTGCRQQMLPHDFSSRKKQFSKCRSDCWSEC
ncbi:hypothetical protein Barb7_00705 [Bacteroidales bacterium Barb7]|nr:hypothetical protein Barb7_00705 [Bacteroidales bacterium Barb7]